MTDESQNPPPAPHHGAETPPAPPPTEPPPSAPPVAPTPPAATAGAGSSSKDERNWAMFTHLAAAAGYIGIPFGNIIGPLVLWLLKKDEMPFVDRAGKEALNFQISLTIYAIVSLVLMLIAIGFLLLIAVYIVGIIFTIIATIKAANGEDYQYPLTIRFIN